MVQCPASVVSRHGREQHGTCEYSTIPMDIQSHYTAKEKWHSRVCRMCFTHLGEAVDDGVVDAGQPGRLVHLGRGGEGSGARVRSAGNAVY